MGHSWERNQFQVSRWSTPYEAREHPPLSRDRGGDDVLGISAYPNAAG